MTDQIRIMLVDDHPIFREGLAAIISAEPNMVVVAEAMDGRQAIELFRTHIPDIVLMDIKLPIMDGADATKKICKEFPDARIIILTAYDDGENIFRALSAGARAYILKNVMRKEILEIVKAVYAGERRIHPVAAARMAESLPRVTLTKREFEVLGYMARGLRNKDIAIVLNISKDTVKVHIRNILEKLGAIDRTEAVTTAIQRGIIRLE